MSPKILAFRKILQIHENNIVNPQNIWFLFHRRENPQIIEQQLKFEIEKGREAQPRNLKLLLIFLQALRKFYDTPIMRIW